MIRMADSARQQSRTKGDIIMCALGRLICRMRATLCVCVCCPRECLTFYARNYERRPHIRLVGRTFVRARANDVGIRGCVNNSTNSPVCGCTHPNGIIARGQFCTYHRHARVTKVRCDVVSRLVDNLLLACPPTGATVECVQKCLCPIPIRFARVSHSTKQ